MELVNAANHIAAQNDRWLFIGTLIVLGIFALGVMRYFVRQHERLIDDHKSARDSYQSSLRDIVADQNKHVVDLTAVLTRNTEAIKNCGQIMEGCSTELRLCRAQNERLA